MTQEKIDRFLDLYTELRGYIPGIVVTDSIEKGVRITIEGIEVFTADGEGASAATLLFMSGMVVASRYFEK